MATFQRSSALQMARCTTSTFSMRSCPRSALSTLWTEPMSILSGFSSSRFVRHSSSCVPKRMLFFSDATRTPWTPEPACDRITRLSRADHRGKGLTEVRSRQRKHCPVTGRIKQCEPHCWQQQDGERKGVFSLSSSRLRKRVLLKSPVLKKGTPGSVRGRFGQLAVLPRWRIGASPRLPDTDSREYAT